MKAGHGRTKLNVRIADFAGRYADVAIGNWRALALMMPIAWLVFALIGYLQDTVIGWRPQDLLTFFDFDVIAVAFVTAATAQIALWRDGLGAALGVAQKAFIAILAVVVLVRLAVTIGLVFLVLPGVALAIFLGLAAVITMAERPGIFASLRQSFDMVLSAWAKVLGAYIIYILSLAALVVVALFIVSFATIGVPDPYSGHLADGALSAVLSISHTVFAVSVYQVLTRARDAKPAEAFD
jgi:hypothetical protein